MPRTPLGRLVLATGWFCFPLALVLGNLAPAILGTALIALAVGQRAPQAVVTVRRELPPQATQGEAITIVTEVTGPEGAPLEVLDPPPPQLRILETRREHARGRSRLIQQLVPEAPGVLSWANVRVHVQDEWGLVDERINVPATSHLRVLPDRSGVETGRRAGRKGIATTARRHRLASDWEPEIERLREYQGGDPFRDIDWAHSTQLGKLIVREMSRQQQMPVVVLLQASQSMRWKRRRVSKLETGIQGTLALLSAAQTAGLPVGLVAFDDRGVAAQVKAVASRKAVQAALERLAALPTSAADLPTPPRVPVLSAEDSLAASTEERRFLEAISAFDAQGARNLTPLESALGAISRASPQPALIIALLDVEEVPALATAVLGRLQRHGHRVVIVGIATAAHHYTLRDADDATLERMIAWRENREAASVACARRRVPFVMLGPNITPEVVRGVVQSARA